MGSESVVHGWINLLQKTESGAYWTSAQRLSMVDADSPSPYTLMKSMRPVATVSVSSVQGGFMSELRRLWTPDGRIVVENLQSIMVIK